MTTHEVGTREEWLAASNELLEGESEQADARVELTNFRPPATTSTRTHA